MTPRVFISYAKEDYDEAMALASYLGRNGIDTWIDTKDLQPGDWWEMRIDKALQSSDYFITCISSSSSKKIGYFQSELKKALKHSERYPSGYTYIIPVILNECEIPYELNNFQWLKLYHRNSKSRLVHHLISNYRRHHETARDEPAFFVGRHEVRISTRNTVTWPKQIFDMGRLSLGDKNIITLSPFDVCLAVYQPYEFEEITNKLLALPSARESATKIVRTVIGNAFEVTFKTSRRVTLPSSLLELAGIKSGGDDAVILGMGGRLELWSAVVWKARMEDQSHELARELASFEL